MRAWGTWTSQCSLRWSKVDEKLCCHRDWWCSSLSFIYFQFACLSDGDVGAFLLVLSSLFGNCPYSGVVWWCGCICTPLVQHWAVDFWIAQWCGCICTPLVQLIQELVAFSGHLMMWVHLHSSQVTSWVWAGDLYIVQWYVHIYVCSSHTTRSGRHFLNILA